MALRLSRSYRKRQRYPSAAEGAKALSKIYKRGPLPWPSLLIVDPGSEFFGEVSRLLATHKVSVRRGQPDNHRQQGIVERLSRTLAERLFGAQYAQEMLYVVLQHGLVNGFLGFLS